MRQDAPRLKVDKVGDVTVVELTDKKILDEISIGQIGEQLRQIVLQQASPKLVLDFVNVQYMSSSALGMLITLHKRVRESGGQLRMCCIQPAIYEVFVITRLNEIFQILPTRQEAVESF